ncbi:MAG: tRNA (N(6)-L-threonylcarbamoyladenosine(37)-C(2))-methylthiotransferase MtaB, partial [Chloroflexota bacterium]
LNISEVEDMARRFTSQGHRLVGPGDLADLYIFNTCAVTHVAARKSRQVIRQMRRANADAKVVVTGCYSQIEPEAIEALGVDLIVSNEDKDKLPELLSEAGWLKDSDPIPAIDAPSFIAFPEGEGQPKIDQSPDHTRAFIKVQDGCDNRCTFCIVTIARGAGRSRTLSDILAEIKRLTDLGYQEAVLSGVHLGSYGHDLGDSKGLQTLVSHILAETDIPRVRLSSLEPWDLDAEFFELWQNKRLLPHLHLPLQSGSDETLRRMARHTTQAQFSKLIEAAYTTIPDLSITTDIIVGFPGETDAEFAESLAFVEEMAFSRLHIFRYSKREGTVAAKMKGHVPSPVIQMRSQQMHTLNADLEETFRQKFIGRTMPVLWENSEPFGFGLQWSGLTDNYLRVIAQTNLDVDLRNKIINTHLAESAPAAIQGELPPPYANISFIFVN